MDQLVNVIFDIKFVIGISVLLVILVIWLIVNTIRSKGFKKELNELKKRYNDIKNVPVQYKMNKVNTLAKMDADTTKKSKEAQDVYDAYEESIAKITTGLSDADDAISAGKLKKADKIMDMLDEELTKANTSSSVLNDMLDILLAKQTTQRQKVTSYKNTFRALKSEAQEHSMELAYCWDYLETKISSTEQMFSTFEEWMFSNEFERANKELSNIEAALDDISNDIEKMPSLLKDARGVIPTMAEKLHKHYSSARDAHVYLNHIEVEKNLTILTQALKEDLKNLKICKMDGIQVHLESYKKRIQQLDDSITKEEKASEDLKDLKENTEKQFASVENTITYVKENYARTSVRFGLEGMDKDIEKREAEYKSLLAEKPRVYENTENHSIPSTTALVSLKELNQHICEIGESLKNMRSKIEVATGDEDRAHKQLVKLEIILNQVQVKIRRYKLPNISAQYEKDMAKASKDIAKLKDLMSQAPLNIQVVNTKLQETLDFIYKLYNDVNNVVGTVVMIENTIVFGNRYRSTYQDIDSELTRAELDFRNGEFTQALTKAIATIEKIHPGNYEHMIKENAKGA